ncbi:MAG: hypothetical protein ACO1O1_06930 [Adhaeribacter sp.]
MRKSFIYLVAIALIWFSGCDRKEEVVPQHLDCADFTRALIENDYTAAKAEIAHFLLPNASWQKQQESFSKLISEIENCPGLKVLDSCLKCIETNPPISVISIEVTQNNQVLVKTLEFQH